MAGPVIKEVEVLNEFGIHARPAAMIVKAAGEYDSEIFLEKDGNQVSAKSIMGLLTLEGFQGARLRLIAEGSDAQKAVTALEELFVNKFFEE